MQNVNSDYDRNFVLWINCEEIDGRCVYCSNKVCSNEVVLLKRKALPIILNKLFKIDNIVKDVFLIFIKF